MGMSAEALLCEGLKRFLASKIEENEGIIRALEQKWGVSGYVELEQKIEKGEVAGHPAWEDIILWEEISQHIEVLRGLVRRLEADGTARFEPEK